MCLKYRHLETDEIFKSSLGLSWEQDNIFEEIRRQEILMKRTELISSLQGIQDGDKSFFDTTWLVETYLKLDKDQLAANEQAKKKAARKAASEAASEGGESGESGGGGGNEENTEGEESGGGLGF